MNILFGLLDKEYQWQPISRLAKDLDDYLGLAPRRSGEGITSLIARNRAAMRRFVEAVQKNYDEETIQENKQQRVEHRAQMMEYLADLEAWRQRHWDQTTSVNGSLSYEFPDAGAAATPGMSPQPRAKPKAKAGPTAAAASDASPEEPAQEEQDSVFPAVTEEPPSPRPTPPVTPTTAPSRRFLWPDIVAGHLFMKKLGLDRAGRTSLIRKCGGSYKLADLENVLKLSEAEYFHRKGGGAGGAHALMGTAEADPEAAPVPQPGTDNPESPIADDPENYEENQTDDLDHEDILLADGQDLTDAEVAFAAVNYVQARDKHKTLRRERGFRPKGKGKGKGKVNPGPQAQTESRQPQPTRTVRPTTTAPTTSASTTTTTTAAGFAGAHQGEQDFTYFCFVSTHLCLMMEDDSEAVDLDELEAAFAGFDFEAGLGLADSGCTLSVIGEESVPAYVQALSEASQGALAPKRYETRVKFTGLTGPDMATYGLAWPVQFGRLRGVLKTAVVPGKSPLLVSNSVFIKMHAHGPRQLSRLVPGRQAVAQVATRTEGTHEDGALQLQDRRCAPQPRRRAGHEAGPDR